MVRPKFAQAPPCPSISIVGRLCYTSSPFTYNDIHQAFLFDLLILIFTIWGLYRQHAAQDSALWKTLYRQGILYFVATLLVNVPLLVGRSSCFVEMSLTPHPGLWVARPER